MAAEQASFTDVGDTNTLAVPTKGENLSIAISGTYAMTIRLERAVTPERSAWETLKEWSTANATVAYTLTSERPNEVFRLICYADTSGTAVTTITTGDKEVDVEVDADGNVIRTTTQMFDIFSKRVVERGVLPGLKYQGTPTAKTVTAAISAAELLTGIITTTGATGPSVHQLPTGTLLLAALGGSERIAAGDSFEFVLINTGTGASADATITVNTDVTIVGNPTAGSLTDTTIIQGVGRFRVRYTGGVTFIVYRVG